MQLTVALLLVVLAEICQCTFYGHRIGARYPVLEADGGASVHTGNAEYRPYIRYPWHRRYSTHPFSWHDSSRPKFSVIRLIPGQKFPWDQLHHIRRGQWIPHVKSPFLSKLGYLDYHPHTNFLDAWSKLVSSAIEMSRHGVKPYKCNPLSHKVTPPKAGHLDTFEPPYVRPAPSVLNYSEKGGHSQELIPTKSKNEEIQGNEDISVTHQSQLQLTSVALNTNKKEYVTETNQNSVNHSIDETESITTSVNTEEYILKHLTTKNGNEIQAPSLGYEDAVESAKTSELTHLTTGYSTDTPDNVHTEEPTPKSADIPFSNSMNKNDQNTFSNNHLHSGEINENLDSNVEDEITNIPPVTMNTLANTEIIVLIDDHGDTNIHEDQANVERPEIQQMFKTEEHFETSSVHNQLYYTTPEHELDDNNNEYYSDSSKMENVDLSFDKNVVKTENSSISSENNLGLNGEAPEIQEESINSNNSGQDLLKKNNLIMNGFIEQELSVTKNHGLNENVVPGEEENLNHMNERVKGDEVLEKGGAVTSLLDKHEEVDGTHVLDMSTRVKDSSDGAQLQAQEIEEASEDVDEQGEEEEVASEDVNVQLEKEDVSGDIDGQVEEEDVSGDVDGQVEEEEVSEDVDGQVEQEEAPEIVDGQVEEEEVSGDVDGQVEEEDVSGDMDGQVGEEEAPEIMDGQVEEEEAPEIMDGEVEEEEAPEIMDGEVEEEETPEIMDGQVEEDKAPEIVDGQVEEEEVSGDVDEQVEEEEAPEIMDEQVEEEEVSGDVDEQVDEEEVSGDVDEQVDEEEVSGDVDEQVDEEEAPEIRDGQVEEEEAPEDVDRQVVREEAYEIVDKQEEEGEASEDVNEQMEKDEVSQDVNVQVEEDSQVEGEETYEAVNDKVDEVFDDVNKQVEEEAFDDVNEQVEEEAAFDDVNEQVEEEAAFDDVNEQVEEEAAFDDVNEQVEEEEPSFEVEEHLVEDASEDVQQVGQESDGVEELVEEIATEYENELVDEEGAPEYQHREVVGEDAYEDDRQKAREKDSHVMGEQVVGEDTSNMDNLDNVTPDYVQKQEKFASFDRNDENFTADEVSANYESDITEEVETTTGIDELMGENIFNNGMHDQQQDDYGEVPDVDEFVEEEMSARHFTTTEPKAISNIQYSTNSIRRSDIPIYDEFHSFDSRVRRDRRNAGDFQTGDSDPVPDYVKQEVDTSENKRVKRTIGKIVEHGLNALFGINKRTLLRKLLLKPILRRQYGSLRKMQLLLMFLSKMIDADDAVSAPFK